MKYKRLEDEGTLRGKLHKFNIHSIRKKGDRFAGYLKILTGVEPQVKKKKVHSALTASVIKRRPWNKRTEAFGHCCSRCMQNHV